MKMTAAEQASIKNFVNAYFRENPSVNFNTYESQLFACYLTQPFNFEIRIPVQYYSATGRHQYRWPAVLLNHTQEIQNVHPWNLIGLFMQDLSHRHPKAQTGHREFMQRFFNSCANLETILTQLPKNKIDELFSEVINFKDTENGLLMGHQMHPSAKSREGFTPQEFNDYSPELKNEFQLHYFLADEKIVFSDSAIDEDANTIVRQNFLTKPLDQKGVLLPVHPWQAKYLKTLPTFKEWLSKGLLTDLGQMGHSFTATTSVRTLYSEHVRYMPKFSLNIMITNSVRVNLTKELIRGVAAHHFWQSTIGKEVTTRFPCFIPITDPAFICLGENGNILQESAVLLRANPFTEQNNVTCLATLCQDHPFETQNRFNQLIPLIAKNNNLSLKQAALLWFEQFIKVTIEPLCWMFVNYGVTLEAHQQNLLLELEDGLPVKSYYRDNQGNYVVEEELTNLSKLVDIKIFDSFASGTQSFITHHFIYYLICNSTFGVINALGTSGTVDESLLLQSLTHFLKKWQQEWSTGNPYFITQLLNVKTLPFKGNLLTRLYDLDELIAPLEQQSIYLDIENPFFQENSNV